MGFKGKQQFNGGFYPRVMLTPRPPLTQCFYNTGHNLIAPSLGGIGLRVNEVVSDVPAADHKRIQGNGFVPQHGSRDDVNAIKSIISKYICLTHKAGKKHIHFHSVTVPSILAVIASEVVPCMTAILVKNYDYRWFLFQYCKYCYKELCVKLCRKVGCFVSCSYACLVLIFRLVLYYTIKYTFS